MSRLERWATVVFAGSLAVLLVAAVVDRDWFLVGLFVAVGLTLLAPRIRRRTAPPGRSWDPDLVRTATAGATTEVEAVRQLRRSDPSLSLVDAVALARRLDDPGW